jgi:hypothetical protein
MLIVNLIASPKLQYFKQYGDEAWDGTYRDTNRKVPTGPYVYVVDLHDGTEARTGTVTVIY